MSPRKRERWYITGCLSAAAGAYCLYRALFHGWAAVAASKRPEWHTTRSAIFFWLAVSFACLLGLSAWKWWRAKSRSSSAVKDLPQAPDELGPKPHE